MRTQKPYQIAIVISIFSFLSSGVIAFFMVDKTKALWLVCASFGLNVILFFLIKFLIEKFIFNRIKTVYSNILGVKKEGYQAKGIGTKTTQLEELDRDVDAWIIETRDQAMSLKKQEDFRKEYIGNISHELKTPIFSIQGYVLTLLDGGLEDETINKEYLERASKSIDRMIEILEDLDTINRLDSEENYLNPEVFNIVDFTREMMQSVELRGEKKSINVATSKLPDRKIMVEADKSRIGQVFTNLLVNAIKYGNDGGNVEVKFEDMDEVIMISVVDDGLGIPEEQASRVFERFYRVDKSRARSIGGSGLGLAIVKHIIEAHKQTITLSSKEGEGSTFAFTLKKVKT